MKVNGARAYALALENKELVLQPRTIRIDDFRLIRQPDADHAVFEVVSGKGAYMRSLARDLGRDNIRVNTIIPGNVKTPRQEKWYTPEGEAEIVAAQCLDGRILPVDVAALAMFLASDDARYCTGHDYFIDAGWR